MKKRTLKIGLSVFSVFLLTNIVLVESNISTVNSQEEISDYANDYNSVIDLNDPSLSNDTKGEILLFDGKVSMKFYEYGDEAIEGSNSDGTTVSKQEAPTFFVQLNEEIKLNTRYYFTVYDDDNPTSYYKWHLSFVFDQYDSVIVTNEGFSTFYFMQIDFEISIDQNDKTKLLLAPSSNPDSGVVQAVNYKINQVTREYAGPTKERVGFTITNIDFTSLDINLSYDKNHVDFTDISSINVYNSADSILVEDYDNTEFVDDSNGNISLSVENLTQGTDYYVTVETQLDTDGNVGESDSIGSFSTLYKSVIESIQIVENANDITVNFNGSVNDDIVYVAMYDGNNVYQEQQQITDEINQLTFDYPNSSSPADDDYLFRLFVGGDSSDGSETTVETNVVNFVVNDIESIEVVENETDITVNINGSANNDIVYVAMYDSEGNLVSQQEVTGSNQELSFAYPEDHAFEDYYTFKVFIGGDASSGVANDSLESSTKPEDEGGLSTGALVGIIVGSIAGVALIVGGLWYSKKKKS